MPSFRLLLRSEPINAVFILFIICNRSDTEGKGSAVEQLAPAVLVSNGLPACFMNLIQTPQDYAINIVEKHAGSGDRKQFLRSHQAENKWPHKVTAESVVTRVDDVLLYQTMRNPFYLLSRHETRRRQYFCDPRNKGYAVPDRMIRAVYEDPYRPDLLEPAHLTTNLPF